MSITKRMGGHLAGVAAAVAVALAFPTGAGAVTDVTTSFNVTATVISNCKISATDLTFTGYDPIVAHATADFTAQSTISVTCASNTSATVMLSESAVKGGGSTAASPVRQMSDNAATPHFLSYVLSQTAFAGGAGTVWGNTVGSGKAITGSGSAQSLTVYGKIPAGQTGVPVNSYSDSITVTVEF